MRRKALTTEQVEKVFLEYARIMNKLVGLESKLNKKDRLQLIRSFKLGYRVAEHYYLHNIKVTENDGFFIFAEKSLEGLRKVDKQYSNKNRNKKRKS